MRKVQVPLAGAALSCLLLGTSGLALAQSATGDGYPNRPIRLIIPFPPGGSTDLYGRTLEPKLSEALGQRVVVDNRPGAGGSVGADLAAKAPADGYTLWVAQTANVAIGPALRKKNPYDPIRDFAAITPIQRAASVFVVAASSPIKTLKDLVAMAKSNPQGTTYASAGVGTAGHINGYMLNKAAGIDMMHVPYKGGSPAMLDLQGGRVTVMATSIGTSAGIIKQGKIRALAVTGVKRAGALPDIPTTAEQGIKGLEVSSWHALMAPAKVPQHLLVRLNRETVRILGLPDVQEKLRSEGGEPSPMSLEDSARFIREEVARWRQALQGADIAVD